MCLGIGFLCSGLHTIWFVYGDSLSAKCKSVFHYAVFFDVFWSGLPPIVQRCQRVPIKEDSTNMSELVDRMLAYQAPCHRKAEMGQARHGIMTH